MTVRLTRGRLSLGAAERQLSGRGLGGVVVFAGRVRPDATARGKVVALEYEADRQPALERLRAIETAARRRFGVRRVVLWHRLGVLPVGEVSVIVGVAAGHRAEAFAGARYLIEELKRSVAIWKLDRARPGRRPRRRPRRPAGRSTG